ncbi:MAG: AAA domain-containing protein [Candidatus Latescibacteria bacterium]|nr:AAA domain-containing protein [Candidatus Latescibacterota bacterium]
MYTDLPEGEYVFQVKAVDRDLNYSERAEISLHITPDPHERALYEALSGAREEFIGESPALLQFLDQLRQAAAVDLTVLIQGETGTGKGVAARTLHEASPRAEAPFIQVNCGALPDGLVESELFGHEKGAFTGAHARKMGKVELAQEGTLFLDEIGDLPLEAQSKLLRLLEEREYERVGGTETLPAQARIVAATNRDLGQMVVEKTFREDLFFRLQVFPVQLPPLRQRLADIPLLASYFMAPMAGHLGKPVAQISETALVLLQAYSWPGNVRELKHAIERAVILCRGPVIHAEHIALAQPNQAADSGEGGGLVQEERGIYQTAEVAPAASPSTRPDGSNGTQASLEEVERRYIIEVLEQTNWVIRGEKGAAAILGMPESTLRHRMKKLGIKRP